MPLYRLQEFEIKALHIKYKTSLSSYSWGRFLKSCPQIGVVFLMEWDWRYFFRWLRAGRQPGRWLVGGSAGRGVCAETRVGAGVGGSSRGSQDSAGRAGTRPWVCSRAGMFILGLFSVYRLDVYVDLQIISHQLNGCQCVILISFWFLILYDLLLYIFIFSLLPVHPSSSSSPCIYVFVCWLIFRWTWNLESSDISHWLHWAYVGSAVLSGTPADTPDPPGDGRS